MSNTFIVYVLVSTQYSDRIYIGLTENLSQRINEHNSEKSTYSSKYGPWKLAVYITFTQKEKAVKFEKYLKSGSGFSFLKRHFLNDY
ncbi:MAG: GIY-YIG nuclease family protein [Candidatus Omnitrophica bacterium]|nr:GIY-YIG nuclease family protein [Candidatus Omnitrophota bacterium]